MSLAEEEKAQARVAIAEDVLQWLDTAKITSTSLTESCFREEEEGTEEFFVGPYFNVRLSSEHELQKRREELFAQKTEVKPSSKLLEEIGDAKTFFESVPKCEVCAKGAILYATVTRFDSVEIDKLAHPTTHPYIDLTAGTLGIRWLTQWFKETELHLIEAAYEGECIEIEYFDKQWEGDDPVYGKLARAVSFLEKELTHTDEGLRLIMTNIIQNGGTFCP